MSEVWNFAMAIFENSEISTATRYLQGTHRRVAYFARIIVAAGLLLMVPSASQAADLHEMFDANEKHGAGKVDHSAWGKLLGMFLHRGDDRLNRFDYEGLKKSDLPALRAYLQKLANVNPAGLTKPEQFAFWTNLYNAKTVEIVTTHYPVSSIRDIKLSFNPFAGPWKAKVVKVRGQRLSLDDIEHRILRPVWNDPRVHYAVNCASVGCPNLASKAYTGERLEMMLNEGARAYVNSSRGVHLEDKRLVISSLYDWYGPDFGRTSTQILGHIARYAKAPLAKRLKRAGGIDGYAYDWMLNDKK